MLEPPLHTATRLGMGHRPVAGGREHPAPLPRCPRPGTRAAGIATTRRTVRYSRAWPAPSCGNREAMF